MKQTYSRLCRCFRIMHNRQISKRKRRTASASEDGTCISKGTVCAAPAAKPPASPPWDQRCVGPVLSTKCGHLHHSTLAKDSSPLHCGYPRTNIEAEEGRSDASENQRPGGGDGAVSGMRKVALCWKMTYQMANAGLTACKPVIKINGGKGQMHMYCYLANARHGFCPIA